MYYIRMTYRSDLLGTVTAIVAGPYRTQGAADDMTPVVQRLARQRDPSARSALFDTVRWPKGFAGIYKRREPTPRFSFQQIAEVALTNVSTTLNQEPEQEEVPSG